MFRSLADFVRFVFQCAIHQSNQRQVRALSPFCLRVLKFCVVRLGALYWSCVAAILAYVIIYSIIVKKGYQEFDIPAGIIALKIKVLFLAHFCGRISERVCLGLCRDSKRACFRQQRPQ